jgi:hypothetical protein
VSQLTEDGRRWRQWRNSARAGASRSPSVAGASRGAVEERARRSGVDERGMVKKRDGRQPAAFQAEAGRGRRRKWGGGGRLGAAWGQEKKGEGGPAQWSATRDGRRVRAVVLLRK